MTNFPSGTVTFLFTDIEGSTKLAQQHPDEWENVRARHHTIVQSAMNAWNGYVFQIIGDAFCVAFHNVKEGLSAAVEAQRKLQNESWGETPIKVRMGIHTGDAKLQAAGDYHGYFTMSLVQRLTSAGHGGQILLSNATENLLRGQLPNETSLRDMGEHRFKNIPQSVRVFQVIAPGLQSNFSALRALDVFPNNLPTELTSFVGREKELADVKKLLHDAHLLTLIGPGGTGKTRLSIRSASESLIQYSDGVWLVELAPILDPLLVPRTTAIAIGLREEPQRPVIDMLCDYLREKRILIVLDNCEHLVDACAQMADRILHAAPNVRILASSREALGIAGEVIYRVPSLGVPDVNHLPPVDSLSQYEAVKLFIDRATATVPDFSVTNDNAQFLAQICHRLDGIPLAIELAAAKIRVLSLEQIARRLDDRFRLLTGGSRTALERHQTLRAAIDWSYNLLPPNEQVLFRSLSIFIGGWTLEAAESVCKMESDSSGARGDDILDLLERLINKSIVIKEETSQDTRYRMLETMRQYANEKLFESNESDRLRDRHLEYFLNLAESAEPHLIRPEQLEWLAKLDADYENLRRALEWALGKESAEFSLRLCAALGVYWFIRTYWLEGSNWLKSALSKTAENSNPLEKAARVKALYRDADLADQLDDIEHMRNSAELSLSLAQEGSDEREIAIARFMVANRLYRDRENEEAHALLEQCYNEFQTLHDLYWQFRSYILLSDIRVTQGKLKSSERIAQAYELARKGGERLMLVDALVHSSEWSYILGRLDEAIRYAREADILIQPIGFSLNPTSFLFAELAWLKGNYEEAKSHYLEMQERFGLIGEKNIRSGIIASLGLLEMEQGNLTQAQSHFEEALATAREIGSKDFIVRRLAELGIAFYLQGDIEKCRQNLREGVLLIKGLSLIHKRYVLLLMGNFISIQASEILAKIVGALAHSEIESELPITPLNKRYYDHAEAKARERLGNATFETAFAEGQKMSLDEALDLALHMVEDL